ncbi:hypothetical protein, partial [Actinomadura sp. LOL_011]|uniref:hypothetical protein n=1 Tax=Actinomadura sp. LOL_011 TaxID=3345410 RepID=UPI003A803504
RDAASGVRAAPTAAIALSTLTEPLFHSVVSTAFAELPTSCRLEMLNPRRNCWTTSEVLFALSGGTAFPLLTSTG